MRDANILVHQIIPNVNEVDKALDTLADNQIFHYVYLALTEKLFSPNYAGYKNVTDRASFLEGAYAMLSEVSDLPRAIKQEINAPKDRFHNG